MPARIPCPSPCLYRHVLPYVFAHTTLDTIVRTHACTNMSPFEPVPLCSCCPYPHTCTPQIMPPFDPEMVQPMQDRLKAEGVELCLGDSVKGFSAQQVMPGPGYRCLGRHFLGRAWPSRLFLSQT